MLVVYGLCRPASMIIHCVGARWVIFYVPGKNVWFLTVYYIALAISQSYRSFRFSFFREQVIQHPSELHFIDGTC